jgi:hypothetical protein
MDICLALTAQYIEIPAQTYEIINLMLTYQETCGEEDDEELYQTQGKVAHGYAAHF